MLRDDGAITDSRAMTHGFTIIEVMIVLAVTGAMFASALLLINGKQRTTSFNQSIRNIQTELQQTINEVGSGYYPNRGDFNCDTGGAGGGPKLTKVAPGLANVQGTNMNCIFLGKVVQFASGTADPEEYNIFTIVGLRGDSINESLDLTSAKARLITPTATELTLPDATEQKRLQYGLTVSKMYYDGKPANSISAVGFASSLSSLGQGDASQQTNFVAIDGFPLHTSKEQAATMINAALGTSVGTYINPPGGIQICFNSGGTDQSGLMSIGGAGRQGTVDLKFFSGKDC